jgi:hypothetical protein
MRVRVFLLGVVVVLSAGVAATVALSSATHRARRAHHLRQPPHVVDDPVRAVILSAAGSPTAEVRGNAPIEALASDWHGGWYVAGPFTRIDRLPSPALAHLSPRGKLEAMAHLPALVSVWAHQPAFYGLAGLAASTRLIYLTRSHGDTTTFELLVLDGRTGAVVRGPAWMPGEVPLVAADRSHLFLGGSAQPKSCLDEYDATGRQLLVHFAVHMLPEVGCINDIVPIGRLVYLAGSLGIHPGLPGAAVARFSTRGRLDSGWVDTPVPCRICYGLAYAVAVGDGRVFENPGAGRWSWLTAVSQTTGKPIASWRPPHIPGFPAPLALAYAGGRLFVLGVVQRSGPLAAGHGLILLDASTGALLPSWRPPAGLQPTRLVASAAQVLVTLEPAKAAAG